MTEYHDLIREHGLTFAQQNELQDAYDESPAGFARIAKRTLTANNPPAALVACVRKREHVKLEMAKSDKPPADTLEDVVAIALRSFNARTAKYPDFPGDDPIGYAVWVASTWNRTIEPNDIERGLRHRLGDTWTTDEDPVKRERRARHLTVVPDAEPVATDDLAQRLLATLGAE